ncbi:snare associated Golgi protein-domain-containing protein [Diplogelasinospora grovesii]|uniref:Golgi apparatus membrane protein TVP38 n=1 Tax=Diplogelasinospora grovesii TaxID=303347 RepID=A0AAN6MZW4_9PEZI|nr:snare associated Golgi protein-domain-containing protein [Diplogelasinospora grovesii]
MKNDIEMARRPTIRGAPPEETEYQPVNWKRLFFAPKYLICWLIAIAIVVLTILMTIHHDQVVAYLRPFSEKVRDLPAGWLIPIAILIVISFPPLFGHEIVALLCGVVYGLWIGFGIVAAGTFIGEVGTWFAFMSLLRRKAEKLERTNLNYGALARLTRDGGFWIVMVIRFSAIPSHFSTAVFATCGVNFWSFAIATFLTLPKQIFLVYLGVLLLQSKPDNSAKNIIFGVAFAVTIVMAFYIWYKMRGIKKVLLEEQEQRKRDRELALQKENETLASSSFVRDESPQSKDRTWLLADQARRQQEFEMDRRADYQQVDMEAAAGTTGRIPPQRPPRWAPAEPRREQEVSGLDGAPGHRTSTGLDGEWV